MGLRLADLPDHIRARYEEQLNSEKKTVEVRQWHLQVTLGSKVFNSCKSTDEQLARRAYEKYISKHGSRNIKIVQTVKEQI